MIEAQEWLNENYPETNRKDVKKIENKNIIFNFFKEKSNEIKGLLYSFKGFGENLTHLNLNFFQIEICSIKNFPKTLEILEISANSFPESTLEPLSHLINLRKLDIGYYGDSNCNFHNNWYGTLEYLKDMNKLEYLYIESTDINSGLEYLPKNIKEIKCLSDFPEKKCLEIENILELIDRNIKKFNKSYYKKEKQFEITVNKILKEIEDQITKDENILKISSKIRIITNFIPYFLEIINKNEELDCSLKEEKDKNSKKVKDLEDKIIIFESENDKLKNENDYYKSIESKALKEVKKKLTEVINNKSSNNQKQIKDIFSEIILKIEIEKENLNSDIKILKSKSKEEKEEYKLLKVEKDKINEGFLDLQKKCKKLESIINKQVWEIKKEAMKLNFTLFVNSWGKKILNNLTPFIKIDNALEIIQGGIFFSRTTGYQKLETFGFITIFIIIFISIYELIKKWFKKLINKIKNLKNKESENKLKVEKTTF